MPGAWCHQQAPLSGCCVVVIIAVVLVIVAIVHIAVVLDFAIAIVADCAAITSDELPMSLRARQALAQ